ncbi:MFS transporter [Candidatus Saccharibacteria bacterium]|nr:MFS transporter [Candidatus Saccharibacteria bacterium]
MKVRKPSEFQQFYISIALHDLAGSLVSVFILVYLYNLGFSLPALALYGIVHNGTRLLIALPVARLINCFGLKHMLVASYGLLFLHSLAVIMLPHADIPIYLIAVFEGLALTTFFIPYHIGVSRLAEDGYVAASVGLIYRLAWIAGAAGALAGGWISQLFGVQYALIASAGIIAASVVPLLMSPEPIKRDQNMDLRKFPWRKVWRDLLSFAGMSLHYVTIGRIWPFFLGVFVFAGAAYANLGILTALEVALVSLFSAYFAKLIDNGKGRKLFHTATAANFIGHALRSFVALPVVAYVFNFLVRPSSVASMMAYQDGAMTRGKEIVRNRVLYVTLTEIVIYAMIILTWTIVYLAFAVTGEEKLSLQVFFFVTAAVMLLSLAENYKSLGKKRPRARHWLHDHYHHMRRR